MPQLNCSILAIKGNSLKNNKRTKVYFTEKKNKDDNRFSFGNKINEKMVKQHFSGVERQKLNQPGL